MEEKKKHRSQKLEIPGLIPEKEALYSVQEFAACTESLFGNKVTRELVETALEQAGKTKATITQAKQIVEKFKMREVI